MFMLMCFGYVPNYPISRVQFIRGFLNLLEKKCFIVTPNTAFCGRKVQDSLTEWYGHSISDIRYFLQLGEGKKDALLKKRIY